MHNNPLPRLDENPDIRARLLEHCRIKPGDIWIDSVSGRWVGCIGAKEPESVAALMGGRLASLAIHDPPYNLVAFETCSIKEYIAWCKIMGFLVTSTHDRKLLFLCLAWCRSKESLSAPAGFHDPDARLSGRCSKSDHDEKPKKLWDTT